MPSWPAPPPPRPRAPGRTRPAALLAALVAGALWAAPSVAHAQYKNWSWGFDAAYGYNLQLPVFNTETEDYFSRDNRPMRLSMGGRFGGEASFKMSADHWWATFRLNFGFMSFLPTTVGGVEDAAFDRAANEALGTIFALQPLLGIKYVFLTDRFRPYVQVSASYMHLFSFNSLAGNACGDPVVGSPCVGDPNLDTYMPHQNVAGFHVQPGIEWIVARDVALHFYADAQLWVVLNAPPTFAIFPGFGILFYT